LSFGAILLLACGLAMDATAVAAARGLAARTIRPRDVALVAVLFGGSQALMPLLGWTIGSQLGPAVQAWDHWVAFALLGGIGTKMLWEAFHDLPEVDAPDDDPFALRMMLVLAFATSLDALAAGITLPLTGAPRVGSIATIGVTTAVLSVAGLYAGRRSGIALGRRLDAIGGAIVLAIGTKILIEHLAS
jgi:putative Mn2+ efflux pump MntP